MESSGFLGAENFVGANQQRSSHILTVMYWRSYDQLVDFARNRNMKHFPGKFFLKPHFVPDYPASQVDRLLQGSHINVHFPFFTQFG